MALDNQDIVLAGLIGAKSAGSIQRFNLIQNELNKRVLPPIPFLPLKKPTFIEVKEKTKDEQFLWEMDKQKSEEQQYFPLSFSFDQINKFLFLICSAI